MTFRLVAFFSAIFTSIFGRRSIIYFFRKRLYKFLVTQAASYSFACGAHIGVLINCGVLLFKFPREIQCRCGQFSPDRVWCFRFYGQICLSFSIKRELVVIRVVTGRGRSDFAISREKGSDFAGTSRPRPGRASKVGGEAITGEFFENFFPKK